LAPNFDDLRFFLTGDSGEAEVAVKRDESSLIRR
jgi:hypothetical protein